MTDTQWTYTDVILNNLRQDKGNITNFILLIAKSYIYSCKCTGNKLKIRELEMKIEKIRKYESFYAQRNNKVAKHCEKWLNSRKNGTDLTEQYIELYIGNIN